MTESILVKKSFELAVLVTKFSKNLKNTHKEFDIAKQIFRSGTSVGANITEAQYAQSTADFIHKLSIAQKECAETRYWLKLLVASGYNDLENMEEMKSLSLSVMNILSKSIVTTKSKIKNRPKT